MDFCKYVGPLPAHIHCHCCRLHPTHPRPITYMFSSFLSLLLFLASNALQHLPSTPRKALIPRTMQVLFLYGHPILLPINSKRYADNTPMLYKKSHEHMSCLAHASMTFYNIFSIWYFFLFAANYAKIKTEIARWGYIGSPLCFCILKKAVYRKVCGFFSLRFTDYLRIEIINTTNVAKAIINDNASYTLMLITSLWRGKPNTSNYLM